jgi:hypothetical protein
MRRAPHIRLFCCIFVESRCKAVHGVHGPVTATDIRRLQNLAFSG